MKLRLPFWQRLPATGLVWQSVFAVPIPSYVAGAIGGLAALPTWDFLKRIRPSQRE